MSWDVLDAAGGQLDALRGFEVIDWTKLDLDRTKFAEAGKFDGPMQTNPTIVYYD